MEKIPFFISILFVLSTVFSVIQFYRAAAGSAKVAGLIMTWMGITALLGLNSFFRVLDTTPPRLFFLIGPPLLTILLLFLLRRGRNFLDVLSLKELTLLHLVRIPVEITLYYIYVAKLIPVLMTFEGFNFDIISGVTAIVIYYLVFHAKKAGHRLLLAWNIICLGLLVNIITIALLSAQTPFQQLAFDQPNVGVTFFPFLWLPGVIVPLVLLSHLASIRQLMTATRRQKTGELTLVGTDLISRIPA